MITRQIWKGGVFHQSQPVLHPFLEETPPALNCNVWVEVTQNVLGPQKLFEHSPHEDRFVTGEMQRSIKRDESYLAAIGHGKIRNAILCRSGRRPRRQRTAIARKESSPEPVPKQRIEQCAQTDMVSPLEKRADVCSHLGRLYPPNKIQSICHRRTAFVREGSKGRLAKGRASRTTRDSRAKARR